MRGSIMKRLLCVILAFVMVASYAVPAHATEFDEASFEQVDNERVSATLFDRESVELPEEETTYDKNDVVRVSILMEKASTIEAGYSIEDIAKNFAAMNYRSMVEKYQASIVSAIEKAIHKDLDVVWNLTLVTNIISAYVEYGQIETIKQTEGVKSVVIETRYEPDVVGTNPVDPNMSTSSAQIGSAAVWAAGYTGAGSKIAVIDTGADIEHEAFNSAAFDYSLSQLDGEYDLMEASDISAVLTELNAYNRTNVSAEDLYVNSKIPFGFNYVDESLDIVHVNDGQGEHGSHVAGIATANAYVQNDDGSFSAALDTTFVQGVAPDAQLLVMKVFGKNGGAYDSDYMAAIEDAVILGADSINLSLGSGNPGMSRVDGSSEELGVYQDILDNLANSGVVVAFSAGNSGYWAEAAENGLPYLYLDDVSFQTNGSPGSYTNAFTVASVDNDGFTATYFNVGGNIVSFTDNQGYGNAPMTTLGGEQEYVFVNSVGEPADFEAVGTDVLSGKVVMCYRGTTSFFEKANAAAAAGAAGVVVVNNQAGIINMDLTGYEYTVPVVSITQADGEYFKTAGTEIITESGITYWTGSMEVSDSVGTGQYNSDYYTMSSFSSWGVPGSLELKPEITAPGGNIYSVAGANVTNGQLLFGDNASYENMSGTSMASPQVAGMAALMAQYIRETGLDEKTGLDARALTQSLLMSTAVPLRDGNSGGNYYPVIQQGAGLANVGAAATADSYILMDAKATDSYNDGKVKAELGDDPQKTGTYSFSFTINNLTDEEKTYMLSADAFTQDAFEDSGILLQDTWTANLTPSVSWTVNGKSVEDGEDLIGMDFNGDGIVNAADGQILLDYATGLDVTLVNTDKADLDADGEIDSYDSYLFFAKLQTSGATVPANGSAQVSVTIKLSAGDRKWLDCYENGAYIQAYVYAESLSSEEGVAGTTHSIPMLAYYGNWSDPSMFDKGSYVEFAYGLENRPPYLYESGYSAGQYNGLLVSYSDMSGEYWFGGNPMVMDETYMPERNAISAARGDKISKLGFTAIRNAADSYYQLINADTGEAYINESVGEVSSAYYYVNGGVWRNTFYTLNTGFSPADIPEGTNLELGLTLVPEYYVDAEGNVNWDALGEGVTFSMPMVVDNTAPKLDAVKITNEALTLEVTATDNQYIAAVALYDIYGQYLYSYIGANALQAAGDTVDFVLDLSQVNGPSFLLQVYDYAMNTTTYEITDKIGEVTDTVESISMSASELLMVAGSTEKLTAIVSPVNASNRSVVWSSSDETVATVDENGVVTAVAGGKAVITATADADATISATCAVTVFQLDSTLYGVLQDADGNPMQFSWDLTNDTTWTAGNAIEPYVENVAYDAYRDTMFIQDSSSSKMYQLNPATGETIAVSGDAAAFGAPCFDMATSTLFGDENTTNLFGVYGGYLLGPDVNVDNGFTSGWNLASYLGSYTGASRFVAICDYGYDYDAETGAYSDVYLALDNSGVLWALYFDGTGSLGMGFIPTNLNLPYTMYSTSQYCSLISDANGDLFLSHFTGETNEIYFLTFNSDSGVFESMYVGNVGAEVWPAALYKAEANTAVSGDAELNNANVVDACKMVASGLEKQNIEIPEKETTGSLNSVSGETTTVAPLSKSEVTEDKNTVTITVTAKDATGASTDSTNGVSTVNYDAAVLELTDIQVEGDYTSVNEAEGTVTFGYVDLEGIPADETVATLVFAVKAEEDTSVTVTTKEVNDQDSGYMEELAADIACEHRWADPVFNWAADYSACTVTYTCANGCGETAVCDCEVTAETTEATCEEDGLTVYTATYGEDSDSKEVVIPATGHNYENGVCTECGEEDPDYEEPTEPSEPSEPSKPSWGNWWDWIFGGWWDDEKCEHAYTSVVTDPTCEQKGYTTHTCDKCGDSYKDTYTDALGHAWDEGQVTQEATCTKDGKKTYTCDTCGKTKCETIKATGHEYVDGTCEHCGEKENTKPGWGGIWDWFFGWWN